MSPPTLRLEKYDIGYVCHQCGTEYLRWQGQCSGCHQWNTLEETSLIHKKKSGKRTVKLSNTPLLLEQIVPFPEVSLSTGIAEMDAVLGKGLVKGSVGLLGGEPGIGKSTLSLQIAQHISKRGLSVLYVTGEESVQHIYQRSQRLGFNGAQLYVLSETNVEGIKKAFFSIKPRLFILDSVQVVYDPELPSISGSVNQIRQCAEALSAMIKEEHSIGLFIGHITKEGYIAGPKVLEHLVDFILYFEGERSHKYRVIRSFKNRFFNTHEIGLFEMAETGLKEVSNPSALFMDESTLRNPGSVVCPVMEGSRALLIEVQALVVDTGFGLGKRTYLGVDSNRANVMIAAMEKLLGIKLSTKDIILNIIGGIKISEPSLDLAIVMAILSSLLEKPVQEKMGVMGEVGLTGEIRPVPYIGQRLKELRKMGFSAGLVPLRNQESTETIQGIGLRYVKNISDVIQYLEKGK